MLILFQINIFHIIHLTGAERREWMGMGVAGITTNTYCLSFPHSLRLEPGSHYAPIH